MLGTGENTKGAALASKVRTRFWIELGMAVASAASLFLTLIWREWIEFAFRVDPDGGSGSAEWTIVALTTAAVVAFAVLSRYEWRRATAMA